MHCTKACLILLASACFGADFSGESALQFTRRVVSFGPRPPGSAAIHRLQSYILAQLRSKGAQVTEDNFNGATPDGSVPMKNIVGRWPGKTGRAVVFTGHYDTKRMPGFVGANDGGSSTGFLLEMARLMPGEYHGDDVYIVFFDGEEAIREWTATDSLYGSRHLAEKWGKEGFSGKVKALINVDMIGDKDLNIAAEGNSSPLLRNLVWKTAAELGYGKFFLNNESAIEDDHMPFIRTGVNALDLIDFDYGPGNAYWHTPKDTLDKLGAHSFQVVGDVVVNVFRKLEK